MGKGKGIRRLTPEREKWFPALRSADYEVTSDETIDATAVKYNCIAHAADDQTRKWGCPSFPSPSYYWPPGAKRGTGLDALVSAFEAIGYEQCKDGGLDPIYEKVALYVDRFGEWAHAAKQTPEGHWSSKLGDIEDIRHARPSDVACDDYGDVAQYMRRKKSDNQN